MKSIIKILIAFMALMMLIAGCEYDTNSVVYDKDFTYPEGPSIARLEPDLVAPPGANTITVIGSNFGENKEQNRVYFDVLQPEVIEASPTAITVRRPNLISDSITVKVVAYNSYSIVKYGPYKIEQVITDYGNFIDLKILSAILFDEDGNGYIFQKTPRTIWKITPDGEKTEIHTPSKIVTDAKVGPGGVLVMCANNKKILQLDLTTMEESTWNTAPGKISFADFDANGNFYGGGERSDLYVLAANGNMSGTGLYKRYFFRCIRVFDEYVYLLAENTRPDDVNPELGFWRHKILNANGELGDQELVLNWEETGDYASSNPTYFTFDQNGMMVVATDNENPIFMLDINTDKQDVLYKDILTPPYDYIVWGPNDIYVILGGDELKVKKIGMNAPGAPYYGMTL